MQQWDSSSTTSVRLAHEGAMWLRVCCWRALRGRFLSKCVICVCVKWTCPKILSSQRFQLSHADAFFYTFHTNICHFNSYICSCHRLIRGSFLFQIRANRSQSGGHRFQDLRAAESNWKMGCSSLKSSSSVKNPSSTKKNSKSEYCKSRNKSLK